MGPDVVNSSGIMFKVLMYTTFFEKKIQKSFQGFNKTKPSKKFNCEKILLSQVWIQVSLAQVLKFEMWKGKQKGQYDKKATMWKLQNNHHAKFGRVEVC
jgi:hypothetical protein